MARQMQTHEGDATERQATAVAEGEAVRLNAKASLPPVPPYDPDLALITYLEKGTRPSKRIGSAPN